MAALRARTEGLRHLGTTLAPQQAWQVLQGLETLALRAEQQAKNALKLARWLQIQPDVARVTCPGLDTHPHFERAKKRRPRGAGGVLTFELKGGRAAGEVVIQGRGWPSTSPTWATPAHPSFIRPAPYTASWTRRRKRQRA